MYSSPIFMIILDFGIIYISLPQKFRKEKLESDASSQSSSDSEAEGEGESSESDSGSDSDESEKVDNTVSREEKKMQYYIELIQKREAMEKRKQERKTHKASSSKDINDAVSKTTNKSRGRAAKDTSKK